MTTTGHLGRALLLLSFVLAACGGTSLDMPGDAASPDAASPDAVSPDAPPGDTATPTRCDFTGRWIGYETTIITGHGELFETQETRDLSLVDDGEALSSPPASEGATVTGSYRPWERSVRFRLRESARGDETQYVGTVSADCDSMQGSYRNETTGGRWALHRFRCPTPLRALTLPYEHVTGTLSGTPVQAGVGCVLTQRDPAPVHAYSLTLTRRQTLFLRGFGDGGLSLEVRPAGCGGTTLAMVCNSGTNNPTESRTPLEPGEYVVLISPLGGGDGSYDFEMRAEP